MAEKFPYLARQINGPIAESFGKGIDSVYENDAEFINFLSRFSIDALEGKWLDALGMLLGLPRPWVEVPMIQEALITYHILYLTLFLTRFLQIEMLSLKALLLRQAWAVSLMIQTEI